MKNFLDISELNHEKFLNIFSIKDDKNFLKNKTIGLLFEKPSTRTRLSFSVAINQLGGNVIDLNLDNLNFSRNESFIDTLKAMNCYLDGLIFRTDNHEKLITASTFFKKNVINALSDKSHPCQIVSDLFTLYERFQSLKLNIIWMGDINNVCYSLCEAAIIFKDINLDICSDFKNYSGRYWGKEQNINFIENIDELDLNRAHCVMTDVFISMNDHEDKSKVDYLILPKRA